MFEFLLSSLALASLTAAGTIAYEVILQGLPVSPEAVFITVIGPLAIAAYFGNNWLQDSGEARVSSLLKTTAGKAALRDWKAMMALCFQREEDCDDLLVRYRLWGYFVFPLRHRRLLDQRPAMRRLFVKHFSRQLGLPNTLLLLAFGPYMAPAASSSHERLQLIETYPELLEIPSASMP